MEPTRSPLAAAPPLTEDSSLLYDDETTDLDSPEEPTGDVTAEAVVPQERRRIPKK